MKKHGVVTHKGWMSPPRGNGHQCFSKMVWSWLVMLIFLQIFMPEEFHGLLGHFSFQVWLSWHCCLWYFDELVSPHCLCIAMWPCQLGPLHCNYSVHAIASRPLVMHFQWMRMMVISPLMASSSQSMLCIVTMSSFSSCLTSAWTISSCWKTEKESKTRWTILKMYASGNLIWVVLQ